MAVLVAPDGKVYVINDNGPDQADVSALVNSRADAPPRKNINQLLGWTSGPHGQRKAAGNWQLLEDIKWAENGIEYIPLIGSAANAHPLARPPH